MPDAARPRRRAASARRLRLPAAAAIATVAAALAHRAAWVEPRRLELPEIDLAPPGWPRDGYRVALVSDLHAGLGHMTPSRVTAIVDAVIARRPDLVCLLGDFVDSTQLGRGRARPSDLARELARLPNAVAVLGNHDWRSTGPAMGRALERAGVPVLENSALSPGGGVWVAGTACTRFRGADIAAALSAVPSGAPVILMTHDPDLFARVPARVALTVAGHLHGGQVNLPVLRRLVMPTRYGDRFAGGHVVEGARHLYVSTGLGTTGLPVRLRCPPRVPILRLRTAGSVAGEANR